MEPMFDAYLDRLRELHGDVGKAVADLPPEALDWSPREGVNSIAVLIAHIAGSERYWIGEQAGGLAVQRDRDSEFRTQSNDAASLLALLQDSESLAEETLASMTPGQLAEKRGALGNGYEYSAAWALWHALEHAALHVGHIQIMRDWHREAQRT